MRELAMRFSVRMNATGNVIFNIGGIYVGRRVPETKFRSDENDNNAWELPPIQENDFLFPRYDEHVIPRIDRIFDIETVENVADWKKQPLEPWKIIGASGKNKR